jgi:hypothetical protein
MALNCPKVRVAVALGDETETFLSVEHFSVLVAMAIPSFPGPNRPGITRVTALLARAGGETVRH